MTLVPCPDCRRLLSPIAQHCPQCGRPATNSAGTRRAISGIRLTFFLLISGSAAGLLWLTFTERAYWLPGLFFGIGFSLAIGFRSYLLLSFSSVTGALYAIAFNAGCLLSAVLRDTGLIPSWGFVPVWGVLSGAIGAFLLQQTIALFNDVRVPIANWPAIVAGSVFGLGLVEAILQEESLGKNASRILVIAGFALWQAVVGLLNYKAVGRATARTRLSGGFSLWLQQVLTGPAVQFLGLVATLFGLYQMLWGPG